MLCCTGSPCVGGGSEPVCYVLPGVLVLVWEVNQCSMYYRESFHGGVPIYVLLVGLACVWGTIIWSVVRIRSGTSM